MNLLKEIVRYILLGFCFILEVLANMIIAPLWIAHDKYAHWRGVRLAQKYTDYEEKRK